jgi:hypothetical protein
VDVEVETEFAGVSHGVDRSRSSSARSPRVVFGRSHVLFQT